MTTGVTLVCHASNVFLVLKVPSSIIDAFSKSMVWLLDQAWLAILEPGRSFGVSQMFFFSGIKSSAGFPNITSWTIVQGILYMTLVCDSNKAWNFRAGNCCRVVNGLFTTVTSCFLRLHGKDSVTPWMKGREVKDLHDFVGSTSLKNIPTSSSWDTFVVEDRVFWPVCFW